MQAVGKKQVSLHTSCSMLLSTAPLSTLDRQILLLLRYGAAASNVNEHLGGNVLIFLQNLLRRASFLLFFLDFQELFEALIASTFSFLAVIRLCWVFCGCSVWVSCSLASATVISLSKDIEGSSRPWSVAIFLASDLGCMPDVNMEAGTGTETTMEDVEMVTGLGAKEADMSMGKVDGPIRLKMKALNSFSSCGVSWKLPNSEKARTLPAPGNDQE